MENLFQDESKINIFYKIQKGLCNLDNKSTDEAIDVFLKSIPESFLTQEEELTMIIQLFGMYARNHHNQSGLEIKLFEKVLIYIKKYLHDKSILLWEIFGGLSYFKLWMHEEGLISIETIISQALVESSSIIAEYFLPEIIEEAPEFYEKEIKFKLQKTYTKEEIQNFKILRKKHFKWIRDSGDFNDEIYEEIEKSPLRLAIKRDDADTFQRIISQSDLSINATIYESTLENFRKFKVEFRLIEFAVLFNAVNIFKFLLLNGAELTNGMVCLSIENNNYEIIHIIESKINEKFALYSLKNSVSYWNKPITKYAIENYDYGYLFEIESNGDEDANEIELEDNQNSNKTENDSNEDNQNINENELFDENQAKLDKEKENNMLALIDFTFYSLNFNFFKKYVLPFLRNNQSFVKKYIYKILFRTFRDSSCFFLKEFLKYPGIDINYHSKNKDKTLLSCAVLSNNVKGVEILIKDPNMLINDPALKGYPSFFYSCAFHCDMEITKMISSHHDFDINITDHRFHVKSFQLAISKGNAFALQYIFDNFHNIQQNSYYYLFFECLARNHLMTLKISMKYFLDNHQDVDINKLINDFKSEFSNVNRYKEGFDVTLKEIIDEVLLDTQNC